MRIVIRPIRYTARLDAMREWAQQLGMTVLLDTEGWVVLGAGRGRLALHGVPDGDPLDRSTTLAVETDHLDELERVWAAAGMATRRTDEHGVPLLFAVTPFGGEIAAGRLSPSAPADAAIDAELSVMPMLVSPDVDAAADWFTGWGLTRRIASDGGGWIDLDVPGGQGLVGIHHAGNLDSEPPASVPAEDGRLPEVAVGLTFEHAEVDRMLERVRAAGLEEAHVVDEAYNRTLLVPCPDGDEIWVNGAMTDLYGYRRA